MYIYLSIYLSIDLSIYSPLPGRHATGSQAAYCRQLRSIYTHRHIHTRRSISISISISLYVYRYLSIYLYIYIHFCPDAMQREAKQPTVGSCALYIYIDTYTHTYISISISIFLSTSLYIPIYICSPLPGRRATGSQAAHRRQLSRAAPPSSHVSRACFKGQSKVDVYVYTHTHTHKHTQIYIHIYKYTYIYK